MAKGLAIFTVTVSPPGPGVSSSSSSRPDSVCGDPIRNAAACSVIICGHSPHWRNILRSPGCTHILPWLSPTGRNPRKPAAARLRADIAARFERSAEARRGQSRGTPFQYLGVERRLPRVAVPGAVSSGRSAAGWLVSRLGASCDAGTGLRDAGAAVTGFGAGGRGFADRGSITLRDSLGRRRLGSHGRGRHWT